jgi:cytoskeletal protein RodZ
MGSPPGLEQEVTGELIMARLRRITESALFVAFCAATAVCAQEQSPQKTGGDESWTGTRETNTPNSNPSRTTDSHTKSGNRTVDKQKVDVLGPNGRYQPSSETVTETVQVNATTTVPIGGMATGKGRWPK